MTDEPAGDLRGTLQSALTVEWPHLEPAHALRCTLAVAVVLALGLGLYQPAVSAFAAIGAVSVGFASLPNAYHRPAAVMLWASAGMGSAMFAGLIGAAWTPVAVLLAAIAAFNTGYLGALGPAAGFVALQSAVAVIVAGGFPSTVKDAAVRAALVMAGGLIQIAVTLALPSTGIGPRRGRLRELAAHAPVHDVWTILRQNLTLDSPSFRHGIRLACTIGLATAAYRLLGLHRGYWIAMTALLVLRADLQDTFVRALGRVGGTLIGAALAAAIVDLIHPGSLALSLLLLAAVWGCYNLFKANYGLFAICLTAYVVFILMLSGAGAMTAATTRALYTVEGGALGLCAYLVWPPRPSFRPQGQNRIDPARALRRNQPGQG
jgi:hypothetical protein